MPILDNDTDPDSELDRSSIVITTQPANGALEVQDDGTVIYEPLDGFSGVDVFEYTVADDSGQQSEQATVTLRVGAAPVTQGVMAGTSMDLPVDIDALSAIIEGIGDPTSVIILSGPNNGNATVSASGSIRYSPNAGFLGTDEIVFTIASASGFVSQPTTISIMIVESRLQNPISHRDVNASGTVTPIDALLVINKLGRDGLAGSIPVESSDRGPNFYDANGDMTISPRDALAVINEIALAINSGLSEGESVSPTPLSAMIDGPEKAPEKTVVEEPSTIESATDKIVGSTTLSPQVDSQLIDIIASDDDEQDDVASIDEALVTLLD